LHTHNNAFDLEWILPSVIWHTNWTMNDWQNLIGKQTFPKPNKNIIVIGGRRMRVMNTNCCIQFTIIIPTIIFVANLWKLEIKLNAAETLNDTIASESFYYFPNWKHQHNNITEKVPNNLTNKISKNNN
jgi:hypothetical protein